MTSCGTDLLQRKMSNMVSTFLKDCGREETWTWLGERERGGRERERERERLGPASVLPFLLFLISIESITLVWHIPLVFRLYDCSLPLPISLSISVKYIDRDVYKGVIDRPLEYIRLIGVPFDILRSTSAEHTKRTHLIVLP